MDEELSALEAAQSAFDKAEQLSGAIQPWSPELVKFLSVSILVFSSITLGLATALLWKRNVGALQVLRVFGVIAIIGVSAVLLVTGYSNDQLTPIVGLFGAIAGYLLGKDAAAPTEAARSEGAE